MSSKFYAVRNGRVPGIYTTWDDCKLQVSGFSGASYKSFSNRADAEAFLNPPNHTQVFNKSNALTVYVDGSFSEQKRAYSFGAVILEDSQVKEVSKGFPYISDDPLDAYPLRNVAGEIMGASFAIQYAVTNGYAGLHIFHDYEGIAKWCTGEWRATKSLTQAYRELYLEASSKVQIQFTKVAAHTGDRYNELADTLAKSALQNMSTN